VHLLGRDLFIFRLFLTDEPLRLQRGHASGSGGGDGLSISLVLDITSSKDALDGCLGCTGYGSDVAVRIELQF